MYKGFKIKPLVFAGRKETMRILFPMIKSDIIDEVLVCVNTHNHDDIAFIDQYTQLHPRFRKVLLPNHIIGTPSAYTHMFELMTNTDTIYIKLDDDLIYLSPHFFEDLVKFRFEHPEYICIYPWIINNPLCNWLGGWFKHFNNQSDCMFWTWKDPKYAMMLLSAFSDGKLPVNQRTDYEFDNKDAFYRPEINFSICPSINAVCFWGRDCKIMNWACRMPKYGTDEIFLTQGIFNDFGTERKHIVYSSPVCVHYAFYTQRTVLNAMHILDKYM
jgi:hypothetical protein